MTALSDDLRDYMRAVCNVLSREGHSEHLAVPEAEAVIDGAEKQTAPETVALAIIIARGMAKAAFPGMRALAEYQREVNQTNRED